MKKNDLIKTENGIFRILSIEADRVLAIDCIRKTMPKFYPTKCDNLSNPVRLHRRKQTKSAMILLLAFSKENTLSLFAPIPIKPIFIITSIGTPLRLIASGSFVISEIQAKP